MNYNVSRLLCRMTGRMAAQRLLRALSRHANSLMGIGTGACINTSGEEVLLRLMTTMRRPPYCVFDVGANKGEFLDMAYRQLVPYKAHIHAFEPSAHTFRLLSTSAPRSGVTLNQVALGKESCSRKLYSDAPGSGLASLTKRRLQHFGVEMSYEETVSVTSLDRYCLEHQILDISLLKLDVEGHELQVLMGGMSLFERGMVALVSFEFGGCNIDTRTYLQDFFYFFKQHKMTIARITPSGFLFPLVVYDEFDEQFRTSNFVAYSSDFEPFHA